MTRVSKGMEKKVLQKFVVLPKICIAICRKKIKILWNKKLKFREKNYGFSANINVIIPWKIAQILHTKFCCVKFVYTKFRAKVCEIRKKKFTCFSKNFPLETPVMAFIYGLENFNPVLRWLSNPTVVMLLP